jgi:hypothetical protein
VKAKRVKHLRIEILVKSLRIVAQMLNPYRNMPRIKKILAVNNLLMAKQVEKGNKDDSNDH